MRVRQAHVFFARDGTTSDHRKRAAKFYSFEDAKEFGEENGISLDGAMRYIRQMEFSDFDLQDD